MQNILIFYSIVLESSSHKGLKLEPRPPTHQVKPSPHKKDKRLWQDSIWHAIFEFSKLL